MFACTFIFNVSVPLVQPLVMMTFVLQDDWSSMHVASSIGHLDVVKALIDAGANVNQTTKVQRTGRLNCSVPHPRALSI